MNRVRSSAFIGAVTVLFLSFAAAPHAHAEAPDRSAPAAGERYQIIRATEQRVWRLDKTSGEITVCALEHDRMVCAKSTDAAVAPKRSYEQLAEERRAKKAQDRDAQIAMLDRMLNMFRELVAYSIEQENATTE